MEEPTTLAIWKVRMSFLLYNYGLKEFAENVVVVLTNPQQLATYKENAKTKRMILDRVRDHIVPKITEKGTTKEM